MKRFITSMLGSIAGFWISMLVIGISIFIIIIAAASSSSSDVKLSDKGILELDLSGALFEREKPITSIYDIQSYDENALYLNDILSSITSAKDDDKIHGIFINCKGASIGLTSCQEIIDALKQFKESGKWVYAYADNYTESDYFIASVSDSIFLNPVGSVDIHGLSATTIFYKGLMDKIGVEAQVLKVGTYKSAVEPLLLTEMSEASRAQQEHYLGNIWDFVCDNISEARKVSNTDINMWADSLVFTQSPKDYLNLKIIDKLYYYVDVENMLRNKLELADSEELNFITPKEYNSLKNILKQSTATEHIAVLYANGDIVDTGEGGIVGDVMTPQILDLAKDDNVKGLVLRVNSGGGSAFASEQIWNALETFKATGKPFYVSMGDYAASGGYYISCGADSIYANQTTLTGSIGIFGIIPNTQKLLNEKLGVTTATVSTNKNGNFMSLTSPMTPEQKDKLQRYIERGYETFVKRCADGRGVSIDSIKQIAEGRVWDGITAKSIGLIDNFGGLEQAVNDMTKRTGIDNIVEYPINEPSILNEIITSSSLSNTKIQENRIKDMAEYVKIVNRIKQMSCVQCKMEDIIIK